MLAYLRSLGGAQARFEAKLLLAATGSRKSALPAGLRDKYSCPAASSTHGIELAELCALHRYRQATITLRTWDFGGQPLCQAQLASCRTESRLTDALGLR